MRAILIDTEKQSLTEVQIGSDYQQVQELLHCECFTSGAHLGGSLEEGFDSVYVSDDYLEEGDDPKFWFQVDADRDPPSSFPIAGLGLAHGVDDRGEVCDLRISAEDLAKRITFTQRKFRGFKSKPGRGFVKRGGLEVFEALHITIDAPIIDGASEKKKG